MSAVTLRIELGDILNIAWQDRPSMHETVRARLSTELARELNALGVPGEPRVEVAAGNDDTPWPCEVQVNGRTCPVPAELVVSAASYIVGPERGPITAPDELDARLHEFGESDVADLLACICRGAIGRRASVLLGPAQEEELRARLGLKSAIPDGFRSTLVELLDLWIPLTDTEAIGSAGRDIVGDGWTIAKSEQLLTTLRPGVIEIGMPRAYLRAITSTDRGEHTSFKLLRDGLYYELGVNYPEFRFVVDDTLRPFGFTVKINGWTTVPAGGLMPGTILVNDTVSSLGTAGHPRKALNPTNGTEWAIIDSVSVAESRGLSSWNPVDYIVLNMAATLRLRSSCFMDLAAASRQLDFLEGVFPALVKQARLIRSDEQIARVLRQLLSEQISIRNLRHVLEHLLDVDFVVTDTSGLIVFDDRLPVPEEPDSAWARDAKTQAAYVRMQMKRYIGHKFSTGSTLVVYLVDPKIERLVAERGSSLDEKERRDLLAAFRSELVHAGKAGGRPAVLTTVDIRSVIAELIAGEFPSIPVLGYQELSPELNIKPIARVSLD